MPKIHTLRMLLYPKQISRCIDRKDIIDIPLSDLSLLNVYGLLIGEHCLLINHVQDFFIFSTIPQR